MVAVIKAGHSINRILNYNEQKVKEGVATLLNAANYPMEADSLSFNCKLNRLLKQVALNDNVSQKSVHISLNFDPSERLSTNRLKDIATTYMRQIGFEEQPYLVYEHFDAGHPHIHIVSIKVKADGSRIDMYNIGKNKSEPARKEIEKMFGLVRAEDSRKRKSYELKPVNVLKVQYGRTETKRAISNVLQAVLNTYKYSSLPELNAVLNLYNIMADKGSERSRVFQHNGLHYRLLDEDGKKVSVPIKASDFYQKPTLAFLEKKFQQNVLYRQPHNARVKNVIDVALLNHSGKGLNELVKALDKAGINTVIRQNDQGVIYGITYVDHQTKCVFNGSTLGKQYSAKGILERLEHVPIAAPDKDIIQGPPSEKLLTAELVNNPSSTEIIREGFNVLDTLLKKESNYDYVPNQLIGKGRKKKRKRNSRNL